MRLKWHVFDVCDQYEANIQQAIGPIAMDYNKIGSCRFPLGQDPYGYGGGGRHQGAGRHLTACLPGGLTYNQGIVQLGGLF